MHQKLQMMRDALKIYIFLLSKCSGNPQPLTNDIFKMKEKITSVSFQVNQWQINLSLWHRCLVVLSQCQGHRDEMVTSPYLLGLTDKEMRDCEKHQLPVSQVLT